MSNAKQNNEYIFSKSFHKTMDTAGKEDYFEAQESLERAAKYSMNFFDNAILRVGKRDYSSMQAKLQKLADKSIEILEQKSE